MKTKSTTQNKVERVFKAIATVILLQKYVQVEMESASLTTHHCLLKFRLWLLGWDRHTINFDIILGFLSSFVYNADVSVLHAVVIMALLSFGAIKIKVITIFLLFKSIKKSFLLSSSQLLR